MDGEVDIVRMSVMFVLLAPSAFGQLTARNPVDELKDHLTQALEESDTPLTPDQERQLALLIEEERQAACKALVADVIENSSFSEEREASQEALKNAEQVYSFFRFICPSFWLSEK